MLNPLFDPLIDTTYPNAKESKKAKIKNTLTYPNVLSYVNRFYLEKLKLFDFITKNGIKKSEKRIDTFIKKYFWINFSWEQARVYTKKNLLSDYKKSNKKSIIPEIQKIKASISNSLRQKKQIVHIIGQRNPIVTTYLEIFDAYAVFHDLRKEGQVKAVALLRKLYKELSKKIGTDASILYYFWPQEAASIAYKKNKIDVELAQKRHAKWFYEYSNDGTFKEWYGEEAQQKRNALTDFEKIVRDKEFCGVTASTGRVTGTARICLSSKDANDRIAEGDILVTGMTMPEFVPAMKKAAAVVTDEGGLTCHAAIICRELSIPCVVGTKSATKILRDGDSVEVNANHGVIKITKRSSYER
ncbi:hypothetical protein KKH43_01280 [Patescibacteria group bacterium]|nr:hypothetical protein [Patescibacteria group bacterium]